MILREHHRKRWPLLLPLKTGMHDCETKEFCGLATNLGMKASDGGQPYKNHGETELWLLNSACPEVYPT